MFLASYSEKKYTNSQMATALSVEHSTAARKVHGSSVGHSLLFDQNLRTNMSGERPGKKSTEACKKHLLAQLYHRGEKLCIQTLPTQNRLPAGR